MTTAVNNSSVSRRWLPPFALLITLYGPNIAALPMYSLTEIGGLGGDTFAWGINDAGQASGSSNDAASGTYRGFIFSNGVTVNLGASGGYSSYANRLNNAGQVAGEIDDAQQKGRTTIWANNIAANIGTLGGLSGSALDVNNVGQVTGSSMYGVTAYSHAFLYSNGVMTDLGTLGGPASEGRAINDKGEVVGGAGLSFANTGLAHAFLYSNGSMQDLGTLGGAHSLAYDINNGGQVVGQSSTPQGDTIGAPDAFVWNSGVMTDLGVLPRALGSVAYGINDGGEIVGQDQGGAGGINHAIVWLNDIPYDLNTLVDGSGADWTLEAATDVNDSGQIVGFGLNDKGQQRAFILNRLPEPNVILLLVAAGAVVVIRRSFFTHSKSNDTPSISNPQP